MRNRLVDRQLVERQATEDRVQQGRIVQHFGPRLIQRIGQHRPGAAARRPARVRRSPSTAAGISANAATASPTAQNPATRVLSRAKGVPRRADLSYSREERSPGAGQAEAALGIDRRHLVQAHLALLDAHIEDGGPEAGHDAAIGAGRVVLARLLQLQVAAAVERAAACLDVGDPGVELGRRHAVKREMHSREAGAAVIRREALIGTRRVDDGVQFRFHTRHGVDLAGEGGDVEGVHHRRRGDAEIDRPIDGCGELVDGRDAVLRIDEQPFPVERGDIDLERFGAGRDGPSLGDAPISRYGSSRCVPIQVSAPRQMMISSGAPQITSSRWVE